MTKRVLDEWQWVVAAATLLAVFGALQFFPAAFWFEVSTVYVKGAKAGEPIYMAVDRKVNRDFHGNWSATIRRLTDDGWITFCNANGQGNYRTIAKFPKPLTLDWWTSDQCPPLPAGHYHVETIWTIDNTGLIPDKSVTAMSNEFTIE